MTDDDDLKHMAEGIWYRYSCWLCGEMTDTEIQPSGKVACEVCGAEAEVEGNY